MKQKCEIELFFHCKDCLKDRPDDASPRDWSRLEVGWTIKGLQVWCIRHDKPVVSLDFKGPVSTY